MSKLLSNSPQPNALCNLANPTDTLGKTAEERRKKALEGKKKSYRENKSIISAALLSLDTDGPVNRLNKKIKFTDSDTDNTGSDSCEEVQYGTEKPKEKRKKLFDDSGESDTEIDFEKKKKRKFVRLTSQLAPDDRFVLDEKFCDSESDECVNEGVKSINLCEPDDVSEKEFNLLETFQKVGPGGIKEQCQSFNIVGDMRYDPLKKDHSKYELITPPSVPEITSGSSIETDRCHHNIKKKMKIDSEPMTNQVNADTSKYYIVNDQLIKNFQKEKPSSFSLLETFGNPKEKDKSEKHHESTLIPSTNQTILLKLSKNPFKYDSSDSENEELQNSECLNDNQENDNGSFFFRDNDQRIRDGFDLFKNGNSVSSMSFEEMRVLLKEIVKKKVQRTTKKESKKNYGNKKFKSC